MILGDESCKIQTIMARKTDIILLLACAIIGSLYLFGISIEDLKKNRQIESKRHVARVVSENAVDFRMSRDQFKIIEERFKTRRDQMLKACTKLNKTQSKNMGVVFATNPTLKTSLFYSDKNKVLLCEIPKCASTNQAKFLAMAEGLLTIEQAKTLSSITATSIAHRKLSARTAQSLEDIAKRMESYHSVVIVREPFSRLLSAFRNKIENNTRKDGYAKLAERIYNKYNKNKNDKYTSQSTKLDHFLSYLSESKNNAQRDQHWNFYDRLCLPCSLKYEFIVHLDTLQDDMNFIIEKLGIKNTFFPASYDSFTDYKKVKKYYGAASPALVNALYHTYKTDYDIFGFSTPPQF